DRARIPDLATHPSTGRPEHCRHYSAQSPRRRERRSVWPGRVGLEPAAPARRLVARGRQRHGGLCAGSLGRSDGPRLLPRPAVPRGPGGSTALPHRHRRGRNGHLRGHSHAQRVWRSATLDGAAFGHLYRDVLSQHDKIPTLARLSPHDPGPQLTCLGVVRSPRLEAVQSVGRVWTGPAVLLRGSFLCGSRRRGGPGASPLWDRRPGLPISAGAVNGGASGTVSGAVWLRLGDGIPRVGDHLAGTVPCVSLVRGNQGETTRLVVELSVRVKESAVGETRSRIIAETHCCKRDVAKLSPLKKRTATGSATNGSRRIRF